MLRRIEDAVVLYARAGRDVTSHWMDLAVPAMRLRPGTTLDGEAVIWRAGRLDFAAVQSRAASSLERARALAARHPPTPRSTSWSTPTTAPSPPAPTPTAAPSWPTSSRTSAPRSRPPRPPTAGHSPSWLCSRERVLARFPWSGYGESNIRCRTMPGGVGAKLG
ncbi:hypothetical protein [Streptomyces sp. NPDC026589]|uniref:hypothetical protein n=1 Tax=Streptomyces sp. NPDC026589 TaxID=3155609 RepID=UPI0033D876AB